MKKIFILYLLFSLAFLQAQQTSNRFAEAEAQELSTSSTMDGPTHPPQGDFDTPPAPVDEYIPFLVLTALGLILFNQKRQHSTRIIRKF